LQSYFIMKRDFDFYIVPTPIGNIADITLRAIEVLKMVDIIACEDTRTTQKILNHYEIKTKCVSYHKFNEKEKCDYFINLLKEGKKVALVSDAGTPLISDPGSILINELRKNNAKITALTGSCAVTTFLSQISRDDEEFKFVGFLPKNGLENFITDNLNNNLVFYESPNRLLKTLETIKNIDNSLQIAVGRELTKLFEEIKIGTVDEVFDYFKDKEIRGEIVAMIFKKDNKEATISPELELKIQKLQQKNYSSKDISVILSTLYDINKNDVYRFLTK
jgi:16S rRNA (cytidine1402-2'-O)-methyltransferase